MKEEVLKTLKKMGLVTTEGDNFYTFEYEGKCFLYSVDDNDDGFLSIAIPNIMDAESDDEEEYDDKFADMLRMECEVNSKVKYVKAMILKDCLWIACEREVYAKEDFEQLLSMMILRLFRATEFVRQELEKTECNEQDRTEQEDYQDAQEDGL